MVHRNGQQEQHRHSSYYPENNKNNGYKRDHRRSLVNFGSVNKNHANNNHTPVNDNDRSIEERLAGATSLTSTSCLGKNHEDNAPDAENGNSVRWSKLLRHDGTPSKVYNEPLFIALLINHDSRDHLLQVLLYPEEGWARTATNAYWLLSIPWWNRNRCKVVEVAGTRRYVMSCLVSIHLASQIDTSRF